MASLELLPVELLHRVFDDLDVESLFFSVQYVCKRFYSSVEHYHRLKLNYKSVSKRKLHRLCQATRPAGVIALTLSDDCQTPGQIGLFLSLQRIEDYTRLQSITLYDIEDMDLQIILQHLLTICTLTSVSIHTRLESVVSKETTALLSSVMAKSNLCKLHLTGTYQTLDELPWPEPCSIQYLRISEKISFKTCCTILRCSPHLQTLWLRDCVIDLTELIERYTTKGISYPQLTSLTLDDSNCDGAMLEVLLSVTPSLTYFSVISNGPGLLDGTRWECFIESRLPYLSQFQFAFCDHIDVHYEDADWMSLIAPFQTPFWLQTKRWFVTALAVKSSTMNLFTLPDCAPKITFFSNINKVSRSTAPVEMRDLRTMDNVRRLTLDLIEIQTGVEQGSEKEKLSERLFRKLTTLVLRLNGNWPSGSVELLASFIDLSTITTLVLEISFASNDDTDRAAGIRSLLERTVSIQSLIIATADVDVQSTCEIVSDQIQHLEVFVHTIQHMKTILQRLEHLSSLTFKFVADSEALVLEFLDWLHSSQRDCTFQSTKWSLALWLGTNNKALRDNYIDTD